MRRQAAFALTLFALAIAVLSATPVFAHHGTGISYDNSQLFTSKAVVTEFDFKNPHVRIFFDTKDDKTGKITHWSGEMAAPSIYLRDGWTKAQAVEELKPGNVLTISYWLSKAEEQLPPGVGAALIVRIRNAKGERVLLDRR
jgi:hypothetical protein